MQILRNTIEDLVVEESIQQLTQMEQPEQADLSDVVAAALNQLPPMYATTDRGWQVLRKKATNELRLQISEVVSVSIQAAPPKPRREMPYLSADELEGPAHALAKLQDILQNHQLEWKELAHTVETTLDNIRCGINIAYDPQKLNILSRDRPHPLQKSWKQQAISLDPERLDLSNSSARTKLNQDFASYMLPTACFFTNALEKPVVLTARAEIQRLGGDLTGKNIRVEDISAYALNRLPPMYVTNRHQLKIARDRAKSELGNDLLSLVVQAILTLSKAPTRMVNPIPLARFDRDQEEALSQLRLILNRDDVTWRNAPALVIEAMEGAKQQGDVWRKRWQRLAEIYRQLPLEPGEAELALLPSSQGDLLSVRADTRHAFAVLVDNPQNIARVVLQYFPLIAAIELTSPLLSFALTYTRHEMEEDQIF
ncbi:MAG: late competence development ComFB family protein [Pseudanabaenaceae cyanobacterium bins.68]|nr:late competence development ComFB family protein [Pseudanabaenaceae cyanobacterium bins.68]